MQYISTRVILLGTRSIDDSRILMGRAYDVEVEGMSIVALHPDNDRYLFKDVPRISRARYSEEESDNLKIGRETIISDVISRSRYSLQMK